MNYNYESFSGNSYGAGMSEGGAIFLFVFLLFLVVIFIILAIRLSKSMETAAQTNSRINQTIAGLPDEKIALINSLYTNAKKELGTALLLALLLGSIGAHKVYLGRKTAAILFFVFSLTGVPAIISLFDAANMPKTIAEYNLNIIDSITAQLVER